MGVRCELWDMWYEVWSVGWECEVWFVVGYGIFVYLSS